MASLIAVVGAASPIGMELVRALTSLSLWEYDVMAIDSDHHTGSSIETDDEDIPIMGLDFVDLSDCKALLIVEEEIGREVLESLDDISRVKIVDAVSLWTQVKEFAESPPPIYLEGVNTNDFRTQLSYVRAPSFGASGIGLALVPLRNMGIKRIFAHMNIPTSAISQSAMDELWNQQIALLQHKTPPVQMLKKQLAFNCIPVVGLLGADGATREEKRIEAELREIFSSQWDISVNINLIPSFFGVSASLFVECEDEVNRETYVNNSSRSEKLLIVNSEEDALTTLDSSETEKVIINRIRETGDKHALNIAGVFDNIRTAVVYNVVALAKRMLGLV